MKTITTLAVAASMAFAASGAALAMTDNETISMGRSMLTGAVYNSLRSEGYDVMSVDNLTLGEVAHLNNLLHSNDMNAGEASGQIKLILERAAAR